MITLTLCIIAIMQVKKSGRFTDVVGSGLIFSWLADVAIISSIGRAVSFIACGN